MSVFLVKRDPDRFRRSGGCQANADREAAGQRARTGFDRDIGVVSKEGEILDEALKTAFRGVAGSDRNQALGTDHQGGTPARPPVSMQTDAFENLSCPDPDLCAAAFHRKEFAVKEVVLSDGTTLAYGRLVLATGARPRRLPAAEGLDNIHYLRSLADARRLVTALKHGGRLAVIGGGFIGLEVAAAARAHGLQVSVVEAQSRILARGVSEDIANALAGLHRAHGVNLATGRMIAGFTQDGGETMIRLADGGVLAADHVLVGIGAEPDTGLAVAAGLAIDNGIAVDTTLTTSDLHIMAAGDCASSPIAVYGGRRVRLESWRHARDQARLAAAIITGSPLPEPAVPWFWSDQFGQGLQVAGLVDEGVRQIRRDAGDNVLVTFHLAGDGRLVAACGLGPGQSVARDIRLAEMMIARHARPDPEALADPGVKLKSMLT